MTVLDVQPGGSLATLSAPENIDFYFFLHPPTLLLAWAILQVVDHMGLSAIPGTKEDGRPRCDLPSTLADMEFLGAVVQSSMSIEIQSGGTASGTYPRHGRGLTTKGETLSSPAASDVVVRKPMQTRHWRQKK